MISSRLSSGMVTSRAWVLTIVTACRSSQGRTGPENHLSHGDLSILGSVTQASEVVHTSAKKLEKSRARDIINM